MPRTQRDLVFSREMVRELSKPPMFPSFPPGVPAPISQGLEMEFHILPVHVLIGTPPLTEGMVKPSIAPPTAPVLSLGGQDVRFLQSPANSLILDSVLQLGERITLCRFKPPSL